MVRVGIVGCGYWGPKLLRNLLKVRSCQVVAAADIDTAKLHAIHRLNPTVRTMHSPQELLESKGIDAVVIATPILTHYELAKNALCRGKHVLIEKPMAASVTQAQDLIHLAEENRRTLMVDHTFVYSGAVRKIREVIEAGELGDLYYYDSVRINLGLFQPDANVIWDLLPHDFAIMTYLLDQKWVSVSAVGAAPVQWDGWRPESVAYVAVEFANGMLAHFHVNWLSPTKIRRTLIGGSRKMVIYDHLEPDNQVKIYDYGVEVRTERERYRALIEYRMGDMLAPKIDQTEALEVVCRHFVDCVRTGEQPLTDGYAGLRVVQFLEAAQQSLENRGTAQRFFENRVTAPV